MEVRRRFKENDVDIKKLDVDVDYLCYEFNLVN